MLLFGSRARGDADEDSDVDVLVVLTGEVDAMTEIHRTGGIVAGLCLRHNLVISCVFVSLRRYEIEQTPLLMNVRREGVAL